MRSVTDTEVRDIAPGSVSDFVAAHEQCGGGFHIEPSRTGLGKLRLVCDGCGERTQYLGADAALIDEEGIEGAVRGPRFRPSRESVERWLPAPAALPWWVPNAYILAVIAVGLGMIAFGVLHQENKEQAILGADSHPSSPVAAGAAAPPAPAPVPEPKPARPARAASDLHRVEVLNRFTVGVPSEWRGGTSGGAVVFFSPSREAELQIFLQQGSARSGQMADRAHSFLAGEHSGAKISPSHPLEIGEREAVALTARYRGGVERAAVLSADGYSYLILSRVSGDAEKSLRRDSVAVMQSFRPE